MKRIGFYPGSFDPVTLGHTDVIARACRLVDKLVIGVGVHDTKQPLFAADDRIAMLQAETKPIAAKPAPTSTSSPSPAWPWKRRAQPERPSSCAGCAMPPTSTMKCRWPA